MPRPVILFTNGWTDTPLEDLPGKAAEWGYAGLELACWGDHFEVQRALSEPDYVSARLDLLGRHDLQVPVLSNHRTGQAGCDPIDGRHKALLPDYVWGDGKPTGVRQRAAEEMAATFRAAQRLGAGGVLGVTGPPPRGPVHRLAGVVLRGRLPGADAGDRRGRVPGLRQALIAGP